MLDDANAILAMVESWVSLRPSGDPTPEEREWVEDQTARAYIPRDTAAGACYA